MHIQNKSKKSKFVLNSYLGSFKFNHQFHDEIKDYFSLEGVKRLIMLSNFTVTTIKKDILVQKKFNEAPFIYNLRIATYISCFAFICVIIASAYIYSVFLFSVSIIFLSFTVICTSFIFFYNSFSTYKGASEEEIANFHTDKLFKTIRQENPDLSIELVYTDNPKIEISIIN